MIEWIITSSALILLVILLRVLIRGRVSPRLRYALWGLVLLRLVIPGTFWESRASVMAPVAAQAVYQEIQNIPSYVHTRPDGGVDVGHPSGGGWTTIPAEIASSNEPAFVDTKSGQTSTVSDKVRQVTVRNIFLLVWLAGSVLTGTFLLAVNLRFDRRLKKNRRTLEQYRGLWVFTMEGLATPCLFGLFRPAVYLTPGLEEHEKIHVLAHEYTHFRQRDHIWAALRGVCLALHWYNPLVWLAAYLSRRDCELSCDEGAVRLLGEGSRADYGRTLVGLVARRTTPRDLACCATTMTGGKSALKERIALLVKRPRTTVWMACVVAAACAVFTACTFTGAAEPAQTEPAQTEPVQEDGPSPEDAVLTDMPEDLPALAELPTRVVSPGSPEAEADLWLAAELPEHGIAAYYDQRSGAGYLRYGDALQAVDINLVAMPQMLLPELFFTDLDGDGENELAVSYCAAYGTGVYVGELVVYEWDGRKWTGYRPDLAKTAIDDFNASRTLTVFRDTGAAEVGYLGSTVEVDMDAVYKWQERPSDAPYSCTLSEDNYSYDFHRSGQFFLHIRGAVQADGYPADQDNILYTCEVVYHEDGSFTARDVSLSTGYPYFALTPVHSGILLDFIRQRQEAAGGDISGDRFAVCDVNGDGVDELITQTNSASVAEQVERVYGADGAELLSAYPLMTYYDNGYATAGWSHNQGVAGDKLWPYTLYRYDGSAGKYVQEAAVDGWDKSIRDTYPSYDGSVIPFPDDVDKDGDGFVYYIIEEEGGYAPVYGEPMDYADYALWVARYQGANVIHVPYYPLTEENISLIR